MANDRIEIQIQRELFRFESKIRWVNKAQSWYSNCGVTTRDTLAVDNVGRICTIGAHFSRAEKEGAYPIIVYQVNGY